MRPILIFSLLCTAFSGAMEARAAVRVVDERNGAMTLDVRFDAGSTFTAAPLVLPGLPALEYSRVFVAVPSGGGLQISSTGGTYMDEVGGLSEPPPDTLGLGLAAAALAGGFYPAEPFLVSEPFVYRRTRVVAIDFFATQLDYRRNIRRVWSGYRIHLRYPAMANPVSADAADPLLADLVLNRTVLPVPIGTAARAGARDARVRRLQPDPHFSLSPNWVRVRVAVGGMYAIRGSDLANIGVPLGANGPDPSSFRLFTGGGRQQKRDLSVTGGTWMPGNWMTECDVSVIGGEDLQFDQNDMILFYGLGSKDWLDLYEAGSSGESYHDHLYAKENIYFLTWDDNGGFSGQPGRMQSVDVTPPPSGPDFTRFEERLYFEKDLVNNFSFGDDGWLWIEVPQQQGPTSITVSTFDVSDLVPALPQRFRTIALASYCETSQCIAEIRNRDHHARYLINGSQITEHTWDTPDGARHRDGELVTAQGFFLNEGTNAFRLSVPRDLNLNDFMYFSWFEIFYWKDINAAGGRLLFSSPDTTGSVSFRVTGLSTSGARYLFDVTDQYHPKMLTGFVAGADSIRFSSSFSGDKRYFRALTSEALRRPLGVQRYSPADLRNVTTSPHMLVVTHPDFLSSARAFESHREGNFPLEGITSPDVQVVLSRDIYDNFSGGLPDPMAVRNYCKFLYDNFADGNGFPLLSFLLMLGDANLDVKNRASNQPDLVTTNLNLDPFVIGAEAYATDDWFTFMDLEDTLGSSFNDIAVGRLPAATSSEAFKLIDKGIRYEISDEFGTWRDRVILVADDEWSPRNKFQHEFIDQSEAIAHAFLPLYMDPKKIYLTEFPRIGSFKPAGRLVFLDAWNRGALMINFIGHGSSVQMADEQVFLNSDVGNLRNGLRLPLFVAVSCTIGDFASPLTKSLAELLLLKDDGGVIAAITASQVTFIGPNATFDFNVYREMLPREQGPPLGMGAGLMKAKFRSLNLVTPNRFVEENNQKYNLLGDPSLRLHVPRRPIVFSGIDVDTLTVGKRSTVRGAVYNGGQIDTDFNGTAHLIVREPDDQSGYFRPKVGDIDSIRIYYRYPGGTVYQGTADVTSGEFSFNFRIPRFADSGDLAFVLAYAENGSIDAAAKSDTTVFGNAAPGDTSVTTPLDGPPRVELGFKGGTRTVKPGAVLQAFIRDSDGINTLNRTSEGRLAMIFDKPDLPIEVNDFFTFDHGGSDTSGTLQYPLPDLPLGDHTAILKVSDSFGQVRLDTLRFTLIETQFYDAEVVLNYPNPFATSTYFLITLTDRARIRLEIFTLSGKRVRVLEDTEDAGEAWLLWDGRDRIGEEIANGTYLYVATVRFDGLDRPPLLLRGKVVKIE
jgi:hypothetical protein